MASGITGSMAGVKMGDFGDVLGSPKKEAVFNAETRVKKLSRRIFCCLFLTAGSQRDN